MGNRFDDIKVGNQLEMPASRRRWLGGEKDDRRDPNRPADAAVVTHRWHDPYEGKDYVCLCRPLRGGSLSAPFAKHTIKGLAQAGWMLARRDWLAYAVALEAGEVIPLRGRK